MFGVLKSAFLCAVAVQFAKLLPAFWRNVQPVRWRQHIHMKLWY